MRAFYGLATAIFAVGASVDAQGLTADGARLSSENLTNTAEVCKLGNGCAPMVVKDIRFASGVTAASRGPFNDTPFGTNPSFDQAVPFGQNPGFDQNVPFGQNPLFDRGVSFGTTQFGRLD